MGTIRTTWHEDTKSVYKIFYYACEQNSDAKCQETPVSAAWGGGGRETV
jgi:hypothetical protein